MRILFINSSTERCGVADYGRRLFDVLKKGVDITYSSGMSNPLEYDVALYNYHYATMPNLPRLPIRTVALFHEAFIHHEFDKIINVPDLPRPLFEGVHLPEVKNNIPTIGSFGFGFPSKNFPGICKIVRAQYNEAVIRFNIPFAEYGDQSGDLARQEILKCQQVLFGSNIRLEVNHSFLPSNEMLSWLNANDINLFLYEDSHGRGLSSAIDYALSVGKPIGISSSEMFRHLPRELVVIDTPLRDLTIEPLKKVYEENSNERLIEKIKSLID